MAKICNKKRRWASLNRQTDREKDNAGLMTTERLKKLIAASPDLRQRILQLADQQNKGAGNY